MENTTGLLEFDLQDFLWNGILKESVFREKLEQHDWSKYDGRKVIVKGCGSVPIPTWAYMVVTAYLVQHAQKVMYGEACAAVPVFKRAKETQPVASKENNETDFNEAAKYVLEKNAELYRRLA